MRVLALVVLLFCIGASGAIVIGPRVEEQMDYGGYALPQLIYSFSADCSSGVITVLVTDGITNKPVSGAEMYLQYVQVVPQTLGNELSDYNGNIILKLPGNVSLMPGMFIMVLQKTGYQSKEVHFDLSPCFPKPNSPPPGYRVVVTRGPTNNTSISNQSTGIPAQNNSQTFYSGNSSKLNSTATSVAGQSLTCPSIGFILLLGVGVFVKNRR